MSIDYPDILGKVSLFAGLGEEQIAAVAELCREFKALAGERIVTEGERGDGVYILIEGSVDISKRLTLLSRGEKDLRDKKLVILHADKEAGKFPVFGEMGLFYPDERSATVTAVATCILLEIRSDEFGNICEADNRLGYLVAKNLVEIVSERPRNANRDVLKLTTALSLALD